ncbi:MAG: tRNA1(Val) (adenine(37)-N6)-methyltransferase [Eubacteriales bacterium]
MEKCTRNEHERVDNLHVKDFKIIQNDKYFCYGIDAVLLSYYANIRMSIPKTYKIMDLGTGTGIIPILLYAADRNRRIHGLEIQEYFVDMAQRSIQLNHLEESISILYGDLKDLPKEVGRNTYDVVVCNPPYMTANDGVRSVNQYKAIARHEIACSLEDVVASAKRLLVDKGKIFLIHKADRLVDIFYYMRRNGIEPKNVCLVYSKAMKEPKFVLIEGLNNANPQLNYEKSIVIYNADGSYTDQIKKIYGY